MGSLSYHLLKAFSHSRGRRTRAEIESQYAERPYTDRRAKIHVDAFSRFVPFEDKTILDLGCGVGDLAIRLIKSGAKRVVGVDIDCPRVECARKNAAAEGVSDQVEFHCINVLEEPFEAPPFDYVMSIAAFEHILNLESFVRRSRDFLAPGGKLLTRFGPLWRSPYGAHMWDFTSLPWVHLLFPEKTVLKVRRELFRPDEPAERYEDIVGNLNRITVKQFRRYAQTAGYDIEAFRLNPDKDVKWGGILRPFNAVLNAVPPLGEFGALSLLAVLRNPE